MADPRYIEKRRREESARVAEATAATVARLDAIEPKLEEALDLLRRVAHAIETGGVGPGVIGEETGPSAPRRRARRPDPQDEDL